MDPRSDSLRPPPPPAAGPAKRIVLVSFDGGNSLDVTGPHEVFSTANRWPQGSLDHENPYYVVELVAPRAGRVRMHSGLGLEAEGTFSDITGGIDTVIVCGGDVRQAVRDSELLAWLRDMYPRVRRMASVCSGSFILAAAGLMEGRRATTHWNAVSTMQRHFPGTAVEEDALFVRDGKIYTSAGVTAGMDLTLAMVEDDLGHDCALWVARMLVLFLKRPGGQSQFSSHLAAQSVRPETLGGIPDWIVENLAGDLNVESLAHRAAMSPRNFARVFTRETGQTPAKFVERARVDGARRMLEESSKALETIATDCGFVSGERMRRTFLRHLGATPLEYRRRFVPRVAITERVS
ncbi:MAG: GlxA family transcriptional regulator [Myxococcales bacterium]|jgi:transcriptional regulator GlxA family with amidase domain|nr:MAG: GlxA family transcriptional regulator [Myxococcales bacterium]